MSDTSAYRFESLWRAAGDPRTAWLVLREVPSYPQWWPEIREVVRTETRAALVSIRSVLPYTLRLELRPTREDLDAGVLEVAIRGDLEGFSRFTIREVAPCRLELRFEEHVRVTVPWLVRMGAFARPLLRWNHARMMRNGERGLRVFLAGAGFEPTPDA